MATANDPTAHSRLRVLTGGLGRWMGVAAVGAAMVGCVTRPGMDPQPMEHQRAVVHNGPPLMTSFLSTSVTARAGRLGRDGWVPFALFVRNSTTRPIDIGLPDLAATLDGQPLAVSLVRGEYRDTGRDFAADMRLANALFGNEFPGAPSPWLIREDVAERQHGSLGQVIDPGMTTEHLESNTIPVLTATRRVEPGGVVSAMVAVGPIPPGSIGRAVTLEAKVGRDRHVLRFVIVPGKPRRLDLTYPFSVKARETVWDVVEPLRPGRRGSGW